MPVDGSTREPADFEFERTPSAVKVIFDTDIYSDIDDMLALAMLHTLQDRGEVNVLAVTVGTEAKWTAPYVDLVDTFYGHEDIPVGIVRNGITAARFEESRSQMVRSLTPPNGVNYTQYLAQLANKNGSLVYLHKLLDSAQAEESVHLLRRVLSSQPDGSVVMIQVGYCTNFARLLESTPDNVSPLEGPSLIQHNVRLLSAMAGNYASTEWEGQKYPAGTPEFNLMMDARACQNVFSHWPTPVVASGFEVGLQMLFPQRSIDRDFNYVEHHPIAETYRYVAPYYRRASNNPSAPHDHPTFDLTAVLYAVHPEEGYFSLSKPGRISVLPDGGSRFQPIEGAPATRGVLATRFCRRSYGKNLLELLAISTSREDTRDATDLHSTAISRRAKVRQQRGFYDDMASAARS